MTKPKSKPKRYRSPNKVKPTEETRAFFRYFLRPFVEALTYSTNEQESIQGYERFFHFDSRRVHYAKAERSFTMPGALWADEGQPFTRVLGTGRRRVERGDLLLVRVDATTPDRCEVEFDNQVFVLTEPQYDVVAEHLLLLKKDRAKRR